MYDQVAQNRRRSVLLVAGFFLLTVCIASAISYGFGFGLPGIVIAVVVATTLAMVGYWKSDRVALAVSRAKPADEATYARYHNLVEGLCIASGLPKPRLYVVDDPAPNAFATGRDPNHAAVAVTTGLLETMNRVELEGVLAHELSHIKNYDILVSTLAVVMVGVVALLADLALRSSFFLGPRRRRGNDDLGLILMVVGLLLAIVGPVIAKLMQLAITRRRESLADLSAVEMTRYPPGLISALQKLEAAPSVVRSGSRATAHMWIEDPMPQTQEEGKMSRLNRLFNTHPPIAERIAALREL